MERELYVLCCCTMLGYIVYYCVCADGDYLARLLKGHIVKLFHHLFCPSEKVVKFLHSVFKEKKKIVLGILTLIQKLLTTLLISCIKVIPSNEASYKIALQLHIVAGNLEEQCQTVIFTLNYTGERMKNHSFHWILFSFYNYWYYHIFFLSD